MALQCLIAYFQGVEAYWEAGVRWVKVNDVFDTPLRDKTHYVLSVIAVRIYHRKALVIVDIRYCKQFQASGFTCSGLSQNVDMAATISPSEPKDSIITTEVRDPQQAYLVFLSFDCYRYI